MTQKRLEYLQFLAKYSTFSLIFHLFIFSRCHSTYSQVTHRQEGHTEDSLKCSCEKILGAEQKTLPKCCAKVDI